MKILVTGGAGYIGSFIVRKLISLNHSVVVIDNLSKGHKDAVHPKAKFYNIDLSNISDISKVFKENRIDSVIHMAASSIVSESMEKPELYYENNVANSKNLLDVMLDNKVNSMVFSSSAAVYGSPKQVPIIESFPTEPESPYGITKLAFENMLASQKEKNNFKFVSLRYFNAAGCSELLGEHHEPETHLIPNIIKSVLKNQKMLVFGNDYNTRDGTCIRDYIHVEDLAKAHILALDKRGIYNLGSGLGYSVMEIISEVEKISARKVSYEVMPRRYGDPAILVAGSEKAKNELGWLPEYSLPDIIKSAWLWHSNHPAGYAH